MLVTSIVSTFVTLLSLIKGRTERKLERSEERTFYFRRLTRTIKTMECIYVSFTLRKSEVQVDSMTNEKDKDREDPLHTVLSMLIGSSFVK